MIIWGVSLGLGWEKFCYMQVIGFVLLMTGTLTYNAVFKLPGFQYDFPSAVDTDAESLLAEGAGAYDELAYAEPATASINAAPVRGFSIRGMRSS
jgi:hypothetical protein